MRCTGIPAYDVQRANFHKKMKMMNLHNFCIFMYIWWLLKLLGVFFCGKLTKFCRFARTVQLVSQRSLASINNKNPTILTKRLPVVTTVPSGTQHHHYGIGILGYTFGSSIQARAIPSPSWGSAFRLLQAAYRVAMGVPPSTLQKRRLHSLFMIVFWEYGQKRCVNWRKLSLLTPNLFSMRYLLNALCQYTI